MLLQLLIGKVPEEIVEMIENLYFYEWKYPRLGQCVRISKKDNKKIKQMGLLTTTLYDIKFNYPQ